MNLRARLESLEQTSAPIRELIKQREARLERCRAAVREKGEASLQNIASNLKYLGLDVSRAQIESDAVERTLIALIEHDRRFGTGHFSEDRLKHQLVVAQKHGLIRLTREWYGREVTMQELEREMELWAAVEAALAAGVPAAESEAARHFIALFAQYPRKQMQSESMTRYMAGLGIE